MERVTSGSKDILPNPHTDPLGLGPVSTADKKLRDMHLAASIKAGNLRARAEKTPAWRGKDGIMDRADKLGRAAGKINEEIDALRGKYGKSGPRF